MLERDQTSVEPNFSSSSLSSGSSSSSSSTLSTDLDVSSSSSSSAILSTGVGTNFSCSSSTFPGSKEKEETLKKQAYVRFEQAQRQRIIDAKSLDITKNVDGSVVVSIEYHSISERVKLSKEDIEIRGLSYLVSHLGDLYVAMNGYDESYTGPGSLGNFMKNPQNPVNQIRFLCGQIYNTAAALYKEKAKGDWKGEEDNKVIFHDLVSLAIGALTSDQQDIDLLDDKLKQLKNHPFNQWSCGRWFLMALGALVFFAGVAAVAAGFTGAAESYRISSNGVAKVGGAALSLVSAIGLYTMGWKSKENRFVDSLSQLAKELRMDDEDDSEDDEEPSVPEGRRLLGHR